MRAPPPTHTHKARRDREREVGGRVRKKGHFDNRFTATAVSYNYIKHTLLVCKFVMRFSWIS